MKAEAPGPRAKNLPQTLNPSYITLSSGDIKDLPKTITNLNVARCDKLTGKEGRDGPTPLTHHYSNYPETV